LNIGIDASRASAGGRGIDRYAVNILRAIDRLDDGNRYTLFTQDSLINYNLSLSNRMKIEHPSRRLRMIHRKRVGFIGRLLFRDIDVFHFPNSEVWYSKYAKTVVTLHDIAPLHFPEHFFRNNREFSVYKESLYFIAQNADAIITVSNFSKNDIVNHLHVNYKKVKVIYNGVDNRFKVMEMPDVNQSQLNERFGIKGKFILFIGGDDFRKNLKILLSAYSKVVERIGPSWKLVIAGKISNSITLNQELSNNVLFLGRVSDEDLLLLYNTADLFVFPSIFEGFGLPVLEAMTCGCPVITSNIASLPEVAGNACVLVNPDDVDNLKDEIIKVLESGELKDKMRNNGLRQASNFSWDNSAAQTISVYRGL
jgi:hypothetical protein